MPLDHYVPQVHLKNFYSEDPRKKMHGIRKRDLHKFSCGSEDVCRIQNGSTNEYLAHDRVIEEFLKGIEPKYNKSIEKLRKGDIDQECIYAISGFVAYVQSCSPAGMRIHSAALRNTAKNTVKILDSKGEIPPAPTQLEGKSITELLETNMVKIEIDPKYPQSIGINNITYSLSAFGNFYWEILHNDYSDSPFFTSDFPIAIERSDDPRVINRVIPLAPDLALRILPNINYDKEQAKLNFSQHRHQSKKLSRREVRYLNQLIVQCAEKLIFYKENEPWVEKFAAKHSRYRIELGVGEIEVPKGTFSFFHQKISKFDN